MSTGTRAAASWRRLRSTSAIVAVAGMLIAGCSTDSTGPDASRSGDQSDAIGDASGVWETIPAGKVFACVFAGDDYEPTDFTATSTGGDLIASPFSHTQLANCLEIWNATGAGTVDVSVTHVATPGFTLDRIAVMTETSSNAVFVEGTSTGTVSVSDQVGGMIWFKLTPGEDPPEEGGQGCTPGYWRQSQHFDSWVGYSPDQQFSSVFEDAFPGKTLLEVVSAGGGGLTALGRMTVAALLNASSPDVSFDYSAAEVISQFNSVYPGTMQSYENLKNRFDFLNNQGCPLN